MSDDDLARRLGPPAAAPDAALRRRVLARTAGVIARPRGRLAGKLAVACGLFLAGLGVGRLTALAPAVPAPEVVTVPVLVPLRPPAPAPPADPYRVADRLEQDAERADDPTTAARLYRLAGDKYLLDAAEPGQAERCYRLHLQHAGPAGRAVDPADSWLLMALKSQQHAEVRDGSGTGS